MSRTGPYGRLPTIGDVRRNGVERLIVYCGGAHCSRSKAFTFEELDLGDDVIFVDIASIRRFCCGYCGSRSVEVRSDQPYRTAAQLRAMRESP